MPSTQEPIVNGNGVASHGEANGTATNGVTTNGVSKESKKSGQVTKNLAEFASKTKFADLKENHISTIKKLLLDYIGVGAGATVYAESTEPFVKAVESLNGPNGGEATVLTKGRRFSPRNAALLNGAFAHSLDFDDTHAEAVLHPGVSVISATLAEAESNSKVTIQDVFTALAIGYEVTCRIGFALTTAAYSRGFHNTGTAGLFGSVAALSSLRNLDSKTIEMAFGVAISKCAGSMQYLSNGSWNKRLHPGFAAHDAFICVTFAEAGVLGAAEPIEGELGLLHAYTDKSNPQGIDQDLGTKWIFVDTAVKPFPACRFTHGQIEIASKLRKSGKTVKHITNIISNQSYGVVGHPIPNKLRPTNVVDAQFSAYFQTAAAWAYGSELGWGIYDKISDPKVRDLLGKISADSSDEYESLETALKVEWDDGTETFERLKNPIGESDRPLTWDAVKTKYMSLAGPAYGDAHANRISEVVHDLEKHELKDLMDLIK